MSKQTELATFAGGCFWCIESAYNAINGVNSALSGYMDGHLENPSYQDICTGQSGHAEVVQVSFDPNVISYETLLEVFFSLHDPTQLNRQGNDVGSQYRSAIFFHNVQQQVLAQAKIEQLTKQGVWSQQIVTEVKAADIFYCAEDYHQDYVSNNPQNPYCQMLVLPKLAKFKSQFSDKLKQL
ncbi:peptide-methionine (S)-S-oxide reductase MsrA [Thalassotalea agariperforans]